MARKATTKKITKVVEEVKIVEEEESIPKRQYIQFWKSVQPSDSRFDVLAGTVYWSDIKQDILIEGLHNNYSSEIENLLTGDLALPNGVFVSRNETPKEWVKNASEAVFGNGVYATAFLEIVDEAE
tara:strand:+ start:612 stop:989 length:378 start_codon:yes stop_codon:yes gene_type:complete